VQSHCSYPAAPLHSKQSSSEPRNWMQILEMLMHLLQSWQLDFDEWRNEVSNLSINIT
jgi:hypothetical protein